MKRVLSLLALLLLSGFLLVKDLFADGGGCTYRIPDESEKAFFSNFATLRAAIPPAPDGWALRDDKVMDPGFTGIPEQICAERKEHELAIDVVYERKPDRDKEGEIMRRAQNAAPDPSGMAKIEELQAKQMKLAEQAMEAGSRGDMAAVDKLNAEIDALVQQIQKMFDAMYVPQAAITAGLERDWEASISIVANGKGGDCLGNPQPVNIPGAVAYRCAYDDGYTSSGEVLDHAAARILIVLGRVGVRTKDWPRLTRDQREFTDQMVALEADYDRERPLMVHNVVICIDSDNPERVDSLVRGLKLNAFGNLVVQ